ncbi:MAG: choice-of-anchor V domain-containing protein [Saprospiraceae bacterium]|nr:choice-of-anchor V domain-containing protein [Saprospiraceae bacterium]
MLRQILILLFGTFTLLVMLGNKNGRASQAQRGNTGAPGDETQGGQLITCQNCHNQGPIVASTAISVIDSNGNAVSQYIPGYKYTARVTITASGPMLMGYGFQMIALRDNGNTDLDGFTDTNPNNYKIATIPGGRTYAEHDNISSSNTFNVIWTAPVSGTGSVTFYAAGNGVNGNGTSSGDGAGKASLQLSEVTSAAPELAEKQPALRISPNPVSTDALMTLENAPAGEYRLRAFNAAGEVVWENVQILSADTKTQVLPAQNWAPGVYFVQMESAGKATSVKVLKL